jgi:hypothetical protein
VISTVVEGLGGLLRDSWLAQSQRRRLKRVNQRGGFMPDRRYTITLTLNPRMLDSQRERLCNYLKNDKNLSEVGIMYDLLSMLDSIRAQVRFIESTGAENKVS